MKTFGKQAASLALASSLALTGFASVLSGPAVHAAEAPAPVSTPVVAPTGQVKNVIFLIGDGMGVDYTAAYRFMQNEANAKFRQPMILDKYLVGMQQTYAEDSKQNITDSASAATAMSAGVKTYNNAIGMDNDKSEVKTILEVAKDMGKSTGLVATSEITHATPAAYGAHDESRKNMDKIADDYFDGKPANGQKHYIDVLLGGGYSLFDRKDRNLVEEFKKDGFGIAKTREQLMNDKNDQILGLFAPGGMPITIDRTEEIPSLKEMTNAAIDRLDRNKAGFFLMVEGSQIDWGGHANDIVYSMSEMDDFAKAFEAAIDFAKKDGNTLVIATADHSTGGFSIGARGEYNWFGDVIKTAKRSPDFMADQIARGGDPESILKTYTTLDWKAGELDAVRAAMAGQSEAGTAKTASAISSAIKKVYDTRSFTGWTTGGHTGADVPVYAFGPQSEQFRGLIENTDQAKKLFAIWGAAGPSVDKDVVK